MPVSFGQASELGSADPPKLTLFVLSLLVRREEYSMSLTTYGFLNFSLGCVYFPGISILKK